MARTNARQQGGAVIITIPADILKQKQIRAGDPLDVDVTPTGFSVQKVGIPDIAVATPGPVVCEPLGIRFPAVYRGDVVTTLEDLQALGVEDDPDLTPGAWAYYTLERRDESVAGTVSWEFVRNIRPGDRVDSLLIRYHPSLESACGYIAASSDLSLPLLGTPDGEEPEGMLYETEDGIFTITSLKTNPSWPGPSILYTADVPCTRFPALTEPWMHAVGPNGEVFIIPEFLPSAETA